MNHSAHYCAFCRIGPNLLNILDYIKTTTTTGKRGKVRKHSNISVKRCDEPFVDPFCRLMCFASLVVIWYTPRGISCKARDAKINAEHFQTIYDAVSSRGRDTLEQKKRRDLSASQAGW